jgi:hypothetical protein
MAEPMVALNNLLGHQSEDGLGGIVVESVSDQDRAVPDDDLLSA